MRKATILITIMLALMAVAPCIAQTDVYFGYDQNGNRTSCSFMFRKVQENGRNVEAESPNLSVVSDAFGAMEVRMFPNPTKGRFSVALSGDESRSHIQAVLTNPSGAILMEKTLESDLEEFDLTDQAAGFYFLKLTVGEECHVWKVVKN